MRFHHRGGDAVRAEAHDLDVRSARLNAADDQLAGFVDLDEDDFEDDDDDFDEDDFEDDDFEDDEDDEDFGLSTNGNGKHPL